MVDEEDCPAARRCCWCGAKRTYFVDDDGLRTAGQGVVMHTQRTARS